MKSFALAAASALLIAAPSFAQEAAPATPAGNSTMEPAPATGGTVTEGEATGGMAAGGMAAGATGGGMMMGDTATKTVKFTQFSEADVMASKLDDLDVYNNQNEDIGEIEDLVIKDGKTISGVVLSVGGFLGVGDRYVLVDPSSIVLNKQEDGKLRAFINTSKDDLTNAPEFKYKDED